MATVALSGIITPTNVVTATSTTTLTNKTLTSPTITGVSTFAAGTAALPALTTTGDTNTGIFFPAADTIAFTEGGTESMRIDSSGNVGIGTSSPQRRFSIQNGGPAVEIDPASIGGTDPIYFNYNRTTSTYLTPQYWALAHVWMSNGGDEGMRLNSSGSLLVGTTAVSSQSEKFNVTATNCAAMFKTTGGSTNNWAANFWNNGTTGNNIFVEFGTDTTYTGRGTITYNRAGGVLLYNTTSDYRAKDIYGPVTNSGSLIDSVPVYMGKMKGATQERPMFLAHETPAYAHTGEKDAVDKDGNPKYQQMDASALIPVMWAEIQSLRQRLAAANL